VDLTNISSVLKTGGFLFAVQRERYSIFNPAVETFIRAHSLSTSQQRHMANHYYYSTLLFLSALKSGGLSEREIQTLRQSTIEKTISRIFLHLRTSEWKPIFETALLLKARQRGCPSIWAYRFGRAFCRFIYRGFRYTLIRHGSLSELG
jgi:hypothetical protein